MVLCSDGTLSAWGSNNNGQLGNGSGTASSIPVAVDNAPLGSGVRFSGFGTGSSANHVLAIAALPTEQDPYQVWLATHFPDPGEQSDPSITGPLASPAQDGIPNLLKYATGIAPRSPAPVIAMGGVAADGPDRYLTITYRKSKLATDLTYQAEAGDSMLPGDWVPVAIVVSETDQGDHLLMTVRDSVPIVSGSRRFMRLRVTR